MTARLTLSRGAFSAAVSAGLLLAAISQAAAGNGAGVKATTSGTMKGDPNPVVSKHDHRTPPVVRDHRGQTRTYPRSKPLCAGWFC